MTPEQLTNSLYYAQKDGCPKPKHNGSGKICYGCVEEALKDYAASQLSAERKWWITRIEQERDKYGNDKFGRRDEYWLLDDLLTSVRERGGK